ncbi:MAG: hypothetical protein M3042_08785 [Actinomycetota bacterium]|nr:hypothetical protein [Actinomycetota bacterium]
MVKRVITWLVVAFLVFYLLSQPVAAAKAIKGVGAGLARAAAQLVAFFTHLT